MRRPQAPMSLSLVDRLKFYTGRRTAKGCRVWNGPRLDNGYPLLGFRRKKYVATRLVLEQKLGRPLKPRMLACHTCDNPWCVEPSHLWEGTYEDNQHDMATKGRSPRGMKQGNSVLTDAKVRVIKQLLGRVRQRTIAKRFNVSCPTINDIKQGKTWRHVP